MPWRVRSVGDSPGRCPEAGRPVASADMTPEQDRTDLQHHADEIERHESFNYALFNRDETELIGCVYIDPTDKAGADADIS